MSTPIFDEMISSMHNFTPQPVVFWDTWTDSARPNARPSREVVDHEAHLTRTRSKRWRSGTRHTKKVAHAH